MDRPRQSAASASVNQASSARKSGSLSTEAWTITVAAVDAAMAIATRAAIGPPAMAAVSATAIVVAHAEIVAHYNPEGFLENYVRRSDAEDQNILTQTDAAFQHYSEWVKKTGAKLPLSGSQQLINPFIVNTTGETISFPMFCSTGNSLRWYGRRQPHKLDIFETSGLVRKSDVVLDCGCHAGLYTMFFAKVAGPSGTVFAFDPFPQNNIQVETNAILNGLKNVKVAWAGVGSAESTFSVSNRKQSLKEVNAKDAIQVRAVPLDNYVDFNPTFLKLDVEGFEVEALKGAQRLLRQGALRAYIEVHPHFLPKFGSDSRDFFRLIPLDLYDAFLVAPDYENGAATKIDVDFVMRRPGYVVLIPKSDTGAIGGKILPRRAGHA